MVVLCLCVYFAQTFLHLTHLCHLAVLAELLKFLFGAKGERQLDVALPSTSIVSELVRSCKYDAKANAKANANTNANANANAIAPCTYRESVCLKQVLQVQDLREGCYESKGAAFDADSTAVAQEHDHKAEQ